MGSLQSHGQRKTPVQLEPSGHVLQKLVLWWRMTLGCTVLALHIPCCSFSSRACVPLRSYIWWCHNLFFSVVFLTALLSFCYRVWSCSQAFGILEIFKPTGFAIVCQQHGQQGCCVCGTERSKNSERGYSYRPCLHTVHAVHTVHASEEFHRHVIWMTDWDFSAKNFSKNLCK